MTLLELLRQELPKRGGCPVCQSVRLRFCMMRGIGNEHRRRGNWCNCGYHHWAWVGDCSYINTSVEVTKLARYWASFAIISSCDSPSATYAL